MRIDREHADAKSYGNSVDQSLTDNSSSVDIWIAAFDDEHVDCHEQEVQTEQNKGQESVRIQRAVEEGDIVHL